MVSHADWCFDRITAGLFVKCSIPSTLWSILQVNRSQNVTKRAQRPMNLIRGITGKTLLIIANGLNSMAEITIPAKNNNDLAQIMLAILPKELLGYNQQYSRAIVFAGHSLGSQRKLKDWNTQ